MATFIKNNLSGNAENHKKDFKTQKKDIQALLVGAIYDKNLKIFESDDETTIHNKVYALYHLYNLQNEIRKYYNNELEVNSKYCNNEHEAK